MVEIDVCDDDGWHAVAAGKVSVWFKGSLAGTPSAANAAGILATRLSRSASRRDPAEFLRGLDGQFALIAQAPEMTLAATDRIGSIPLCYGRGPEGWVLSTRAIRLQRRLGLDLDDLDENAARTIAMSGFAFGTSTLYRGLHALQAGQMVVWRPRRRPEPSRYYIYRPLPDPSLADADRAADELAAVSLEVIGKSIASADGRQIVVPLSAGCDSRMIVSGLKHLNYQNVLCYAYGRPGNYEARASREIAAALGYKWLFHGHTNASQRALFASPRFRDYLDFADTLAAVPFVQDIGAVGALRDQRLVEPDAIFINGQTGDFISGNHIPAAFDAPGDLSHAGRRRRIADAIIAKHYSLWTVRHSEQSLAALRDDIWRDIETAGAALGDPEADFGLFELSEWQNRQAKYVVAGQRTYEYFGYEWRLPLWDREYLDFWQRVPLAHKRGQALYRRVLTDLDWGGVWTGRDYPRRVTPAWLRLVRFGLKALHAPLGRRRWHRFERRYLAYWMDVVANYAIVPYRRVVTDRRGHRNAISWIVEHWLRRRGIGLDGTPIEGGT